jgi:hypothetical protein
MVESQIDWNFPMTAIAFLIIALMTYYFAFLKAPKTGTRL